MRVDCCAKVLDEQVRVRSRRDAHVAVTHESLNAVDVDALAQQLGRERVPQIVEAHLERERLRPQQPTANLLRRFAGAVGALHASRAVTLLAILVPLLVAAPAAAVFPALRDAGTREGISEDLLRVGLARPLRAVRRGEEQGTWCMLHLVLDPWPQRRGQRQDGRSAAFCRVAIMRAGDRDRAAVEIDVGFCEREKLSLPQPEGGAAGEEWPPVFRDLFEHAGELLGAERDVDAPGHLARLGRCNGVLAYPTARAACAAEHRVQHGSKLVDACGSGTGVFHRGEEVVHVSTAHPREWKCGDRSTEDVLCKAPLLDVPARRGAALLQPPIAKRAETARQIILHGPKASDFAQLRAPQSLLFEFELGGDRLCLRPALRFGRALSPALGASPAHVPGPAALEDASHGSALSLPPIR